MPVTSLERVKPRHKFLPADCFLFFLLISLVAIIVLPWYFSPASHPSLFYLPLPSVLHPSYSILIYPFLQSKKPPRNQPDLRHSCNGTKNIKFTSPHFCTFLWHIFFCFFLVNIASAGTPSSIFVQYSCRETPLFCCATNSIYLRCRAVLSGLMWAVKENKVVLLHLRECLLRLKKPVLGCRSYFSSLSADPTLHQVFITQCLKSLNSEALRASL